MRVSGRLRSAASDASGIRAIFLALFTIGEETPYITLRVDTFVALVAPLLGIIFAFDAINSERHDGTLPRLLSQPIHRDDVINGKFAAGLAVIGIVLVSVIGMIAAFGLIRLGIVPAASEVLRLVLWVLLTFIYVSLWLAFGMLLSVVVRRAATSALIGFGAWLLLTFFGGLIVSLVGGVVAPQTGTAQEQLRDIGLGKGDGADDRGEADPEEDGVAPRDPTDPVDQGAHDRCDDEQDGGSDDRLHRRPSAVLPNVAPKRTRARKPGGRVGAIARGRSRRAR